VNLKVRERSIAIGGLDDLVAGRPDFSLVKKQLKPSDLTIILSHCPAFRDEIVKEKGVLKKDMVLSGHTHGGQVNFFGFAPYKPKGSGKYLSGWYEEEAPKLYVSKGIGTSILPIRFGSRAEASVFYI
jgi:predicted MPP superfamily phosphohydrolase